MTWPVGLLLLAAGLALGAGGVWAWARWRAARGLDLGRAIARDRRARDISAAADADDTTARTAPVPRRPVDVLRGGPGP